MCMRGRVVRTREKQRFQQFKAALSCKPLTSLCSVCTQVNKSVLNGMLVLLKDHLEGFNYLSRPTAQKEVRFYGTVNIYQF